MSFVKIRAGKLGLKVMDATEVMYLTVTDKDVQSAVPKNSKCCAFARACMRLPRVKAAYFFRGTAWLEYKDRVVRYILPGRLQKEIVSFDRARIAAPGHYWLSPPTKGERSSDLVKKNRASAKRPPSKKKRRKQFTALIRTLHEPAYIAAEK